MKKILPITASILLGLVFLMASITFLLHKVPEQKMTEGTPADHFMKAVGPTGYMTLVKVVELLGGLLVLVPRTRALGLLALGPVIVNILAYDAFVADPKDLQNPMAIVMTSIIVLSSLYLLWVERKKFGALLP